MTIINSNVHLVDLFPQYLTIDSLFQKMVELGAPWTDEIGQSMDIAYFTMYSGIKNPSDFVIANSTSGIAQSSLISNILYSIYGDNWTRLWEAYKVKYTPIEDYNFKETITASATNDRTIDRTNDLASTVDGTGTRTNNEKTTSALNGTTTSTTTNTGTTTTQLVHGLHVDRSADAQNYTYAFNSTNRVPASETEETSTEINSGTDTTTVTDNTTSSTNGTTNSNVEDNTNGTVDTVTKDVRADKETEVTSDNTQNTENRETVRTGTTSFHTVQDLLKQEFELWRWNFFTQVFEDADKFLVLSVYTPCTNLFSQLNYEGGK